MKRIVAGFCVAGLVAVALWTPGHSRAVAALVGLDIGNPVPAGSFEETSPGVYRVTGGGSGIAGTSDSFYYAYDQTPSSSREFIFSAQITDFSGTGTSTERKAGVMIRADSAANATNALAGVVGEDATVFQGRPYPSLDTESTVLAGFSAPVWVRLTRQEDIYTAYQSDDGASWTMIDSYDASAAPTVPSFYWGLAVTSAQQGQTSTAVFENVEFLEITALTWDGTDNSWHEPAHWSGGPPALPNAGTRTSVPAGTVSITAPAEAYTLSVDGGGIQIDAGQTLQVRETVRFAAGTSLQLGAGATVVTGGGRSTQSPPTETLPWGSPAAHCGSPR